MTTPSIQAKILNQTVSVVTGTQPLTCPKSVLLLTGALYLSALQAILEENEIEIELPTILINGKATTYELDQLIWDMGEASRANTVTSQGANILRQTLRAWHLERAADELKWAKVAEKRVANGEPYCGDDEDAAECRHQAGLHPAAHNETVG